MLKRFWCLLLFSGVIGLCAIAQSLNTSKTDLNTQGKVFVGTGFFVQDQVILTARHVINGYKLILVTYNGKQYKGQVIAQDKSKDLALIRINTGSFTPYAMIGQSHDKEIARVKGFDLGYPILRTHTVWFDRSANQDGLDAIRTNDETCQGNSGGPVINASNQVIGLMDAGSIEKRDVTKEGCSRLGWVVKAGVIKTFLANNNIVAYTQSSIINIVYIENNT